MNQTKMIAVIATVCVAASVISAATIPAGTTIPVSTVSLITSQDAVGSTFEAKVAQNVAAKGTVLLKAGTKAFGKVSSSRRNPRKSEALSVELTSVEVNGRTRLGNAGRLTPVGEHLEQLGRIVLLHGHLPRG